jgi:hypothetical protein
MASAVDLDRYIRSKCRASTLRIILLDGFHFASLIRKEIAEARSAVFSSILHRLDGGSKLTIVTARLRSTQNIT